MVTVFFILSILAVHIFPPWEIEMNSLFRLVLITINEAHEIESVIDQDAVEGATFIVFFATFNFLIIAQQIYTNVDTTFFVI